MLVLIRSTTFTGGSIAVLVLSCLRFSCLFDGVDSAPGVRVPPAGVRRVADRDAGVETGGGCQAGAGLPAVGERACGAAIVVAAAASSALRTCYDTAVAQAEFREIARHEIQDRSCKPSNALDAVETRRNTYGLSNV